MEVCKEKMKIGNYIVILLLLLSCVYLSKNYMEYSSYFNIGNKALSVYGLTSVEF